MINAVVGIVITDALEGFTGDVNVVDIGLSGDFAGQDNQARIAKRFGGYAAVGILSQNGIKNCIGNLVGNLIGMAFRNRFRGKKIRIHGATFLLMLDPVERASTAIRSGMRLTL